jgi:hypothetical protein
MREREREREREGGREGGASIRDDTANYYFGSLLCSALTGREHILVERRP